MVTSGGALNIWNAHRIQSEFLECTSIVEEYTTNFHSDGIPVHSDTRVSRSYMYSQLEVGSLIDAATWRIHTKLN